MICLTGRSDITLLFSARRRYAEAALCESLCFYELDIQGDGDFVPDKEATRLERGVPGEAEVFAADPGRCRQPSASVTPGIFACMRGTFDVEYHSSSDGVKGQVARYGQLSIAGAGYSRGFKGQGGELLNVEEIGAFQMAVALLIARINRCRFNRGLHMRLA